MYIYCTGSFKLHIQKCLVLVQFVRYEASCTRIHPYFGGFCEWIYMYENVTSGPSQGGARRKIGKEFFPLRLPPWISFPAEGLPNLFPPEKRHQNSFSRFPPPPPDYQWSIPYFIRFVHHLKPWIEKTSMPIQVITFKNPFIKYSFPNYTLYLLSFIQV